MRGLGIIVLTAVAFVLGYWAGRGEAAPSVEVTREVTRVDTLRDTVTFTRPVAMHSQQVSTVYRYLPLVSVDSVSVPGDTVRVEVPIERRVYADSDYYAVVSGFEASLDTISVFPRTVVRTVEVRPKPRRWSVSVGVGAGLTPKGVQPVVGVTLGYNILQF